MLRFFLRRMLSAIPSLIGLMIVTFLLIRVVPADPAAALAGDNATPQQIAEIRHQYGFDRPIYEQLLMYFGQVFRFEFGESQYSHRPVGLDIAQRLPATLELTLAALARNPCRHSPRGHRRGQPQPLARFCAASLHDYWRSGSNVL